MTTPSDPSALHKSLLKEDGSNPYGIVSGLLADNLSPLVFGQLKPISTVLMSVKSVINELRSF